MSDESKKALPVMTKKEIMDEVQKRLQDQVRETGNTPSFMEIIGKIAIEYTSVKSENEARKSPEQKVLEAKRSALVAHQAEQESAKLKQERMQVEQVKLTTFFKSWVKHDTWLIYDEAMPLTKAQKPEPETILNSRDPNLWGLVQSCVGHSLKIINPESKPHKWLVKPFEWVRWLKEKEQYIHPQLLNLLIPNIASKPTLKTVKATATREIAKRDRQSAIKLFAQKTEELARKQSIEWDSKAIPVTKLEFMKVLEAVNPAFKKSSMATFDRDIADIALKFKSGTKSNKNNVLKKIFSIK